MKSKSLNIILIGPQGSGKGTQAELLTKKYNLIHLEIGKILRNIAKTKTNLGRQVDKLINKQGKMVPLDLVVKVISNKLKKIPSNQGIIFDGTPRRIGEIKPLEEILSRYHRKITHIFYLPISKKETIKRLSHRRICAKCGKLFISGVDIPPRQKKCPFCGGQIIQREDDKPSAIKVRLKIYHQRTEPVIKYYQKKHQLIKIDASQSIKKVFQNIIKYL